jgi:hypothetical protein
MVDDANNCILSVLESTQGSRLVKLLMQCTTAEKNPVCRSRCVEYLSLVLEQWVSSNLSKAMADICPVCSFRLPEAQCQPYSIALLK